MKKYTQTQTTEITTNYDTLMIELFKISSDLVHKIDENIQEKYPHNVIEGKEEVLEVSMSFDMDDDYEDHYIISVFCEYFGFEIEPKENDVEPVIIEQPKKEEEKTLFEQYEIRTDFIHIERKGGEVVLISKKIEFKKNTHGTSDLYGKLRLVKKDSKKVENLNVFPFEGTSSFMTFQEGSYLITEPSQIVILGDKNVGFLQKADPIILEKGTEVEERHADNPLLTPEQADKLRFQPNTIPGKVDIVIPEKEEESLTIQDQIVEIQELFNKIQGIMSQDIAPELKDRVLQVSTDLFTQKSNPIFTQLHIEIRDVTVGIKSIITQLGLLKSEEYYDKLEKDFVNLELEFQTYELLIESGIDEKEFLNKFESLKVSYNQSKKELDEKVMNFEKKEELDKSLHTLQTELEELKNRQNLIPALDSLAVAVISVEKETSDNSKLYVLRVRKSLKDIIAHFGQGQKWMNGPKEKGRIYTSDTPFDLSGKLFSNVKIGEEVVFVREEDKIEIHQITISSLSKK